MKSVFVTRATQPNFWKFALGAFGIFRTRQLTNNGRYVQQLEEQLKKIWQVENVVIMANGTLPLMCLLSSIEKGSVVVTTPFSFVATTSAIVTEGHKPVFVDLEKDSLNINMGQMRTLVAERNPGAIMFTHTYGISSNFDEYERLSEIAGVPLFLDASHCFNFGAETGSLLSRGAASTVSFHATKIFSTVEGGALVTNDKNLAEYARRWRNFGIQEGDITQIGVNAKMSELHALYGLVNLKRVEKDLSRRKKLQAKYETYYTRINLGFFHSPNASYIPVYFESTKILESVIARLKSTGIFPRRYFFPSLNLLYKELDFEYQSCPNAESLASRILCLPIGDDVDAKVLERILGALKG